jgi:hypothetical protein
LIPILTYPRQLNHYSGFQLIVSQITGSNYTMNYATIFEPLTPF